MWDVTLLCVFIYIYTNMNGYERYFFSSIPTVFTLLLSHYSRPTFCIPTLSALSLIRACHGSQYQYAYPNINYLTPSNNICREHDHHVHPFNPYSSCSPRFHASHLLSLLHAIVLYPSQHAQVKHSVTKHSKNRIQNGRGKMKKEET